MLYCLSIFIINHINIFFFFKSLILLTSVEVSENYMFGDELAFLVLLQKKKKTCYLPVLQTFLMNLQLALSQTSPGFYMSVVYKPFENTLGNGEIARYEQFLIFSQYFLPVRELSTIFVKFEIVICKLFQFGRV